MEQITDETNSPPPLRALVGFSPGTVTPHPPPLPSPTLSVLVIFSSSWGQLPFLCPKPMSKHGKPSDFGPVFPFTIIPCGAGSWQTAPM